MLSHSTDSTTSEPATPLFVLPSQLSFLFSSLADRSCPPLLLSLLSTTSSASNRRPRSRALHYPDSTIHRSARRQLRISRFHPRAFPFSLERGLSSYLKTDCNTQNITFNNAYNYSYISSTLNAYINRPKHPTASRTRRSTISGMKLEITRDNEGIRGSPTIVCILRQAVLTLGRVA